MPERELLAEKRNIEAMTTAVLADDALAQAMVALRLEPGAENSVRAAAGILAGIFTALGQKIGRSPLETWQRHMAGTATSRGADG